MSRPKLQFRLMKRGKFYYYKLPNQKTFHSTGETTKASAQEYVIDLLNKGIPINKNTIRAFCKDFYIYDKCFHVKRLLNEGKSIGRNHCKNRRLTLEKYIFTDMISDKKLADINRGDILDFRDRLLNKGVGENTVNKVIGILKTAFNEAILREQINRNPTFLIGNIKYQEKEIGIFTVEEIKEIFPKDTLGPWPSLLDYTCFFLTCMTGMRRGEVLALEWRDIDFKKKYLTVNSAWKSRNEKGKPKWGRIRYVALPSILINKLLELKLEQIEYGSSTQLSIDDRLVFCYPNGTRLGETWWRRHFANAMKKAKINYEERNLTPKSFRHSLNMILKDQGYSNEKIRASLGWLSNKVQEGYTHWKPEHLIDQGLIIEDILRRKNER